MEEKKRGEKKREKEMPCVEGEKRKRGNVITIFSLFFYNKS